MTKLFDITQAAAAETATIPLLRGDGVPLYNGDGADKEQLSITVYGPGSRPYVDAMSKRENRLIDRVRRKGRAELSADDKIAEEAKFLASITVTFNGFNYPPKPDATGYDLFVAVYSDPKLGFIKDQVAAAAGDWERFTSGSATS